MLLGGYLNGCGGSKEGAPMSDRAGLPVSVTRGPYDGTKESGRSTSV